MKRTDLPDFSAARGLHLLTALSGGADSVALLYMLADAREALGLTLSAAHIDHAIREDSAADAEFCRALCVQLNVPFYAERIDVPAIASECGEGLETAARRVRYDALERIRRETGADRIALAHHLDDQAETTLMHLLRGCGPDGIGGMDALSGHLYRPLLDTPKASLVKYLENRGAQWRTDSTNFMPDTPRNVLRLHGLPALEESYPTAASAIARYAEAARCENRYMERQTEAFLSSQLDFGPYGRRIRRPETTDEAILRRALRRICGPALSYDKLMELIALCAKPRGQLEISGTLRCERTPGAIYFLPKSRELPAPVPLTERRRASLDGIGSITLYKAPAVPVRDDPHRQVLRSDALEGAVLRTRLDGDRIRPLGCGDRLLSDVLTDRKIDRPLRDTLPLVAVGNRVLWAVGVCISEDAKIRSESDEAALLQWRPAVYQYGISDDITSEE